MGFNRDIHHRQSIRFPTFDYSSSGAYFVTMCAYLRVCLSGEIEEGEMRLNEVGRIIQSVWDELPLKYPNIETDEFVIMPNHVHGIIWIVDPVGAGPCARPSGMHTDPSGRHADSIDRHADSLGMHTDPSGRHADS